MNRYHPAIFLSSSAKVTQLPLDEGYEVAFAGRSNAGKSSALNYLTGQKSLARTSKQPGRTQLINLFTLDPLRRLVDLPGYGYAQVPLEVKHNWQKTLTLYLQTRHCLKGIVLLMDIRHPLKETDQVLLDIAFTRGLPVHILLTKADKLSRNEAKSTLLKLQKQFDLYQDIISLQLFSALKKEGEAELIATLDRWFEWGA